MKKNIILIFASIAFLFSCSNKKDDSNSNTGYTGIASQALTNIDTVVGNYTPTSMKSNSTNAVNIMSTNVCSGYDLFTCQPILIKLYLDIGKQYLTLMKTILAGLSKNLTNVSDGGSGTFQGSDLSINYSKTNSSTFGVLGKTSENNSYIYFSSSATSYHFMIDFSQLPNSQRDSSSPSQGKIDVTLEYTDPSHWLITILGVNFACNTSDPTAPQMFKIIMHMNDTLWIGKTILYNGHWITSDATSPTCSTPDDASISGNIYSEFIADSLAAQSNVYIMKSDVTDFPTNKSYYSLNNICNSFATNIAPKGGSGATCSQVTSIWTSGNIGTYLNPFCTVATNNTVALWGENCSSTSTTVSNASFDDTSVPWVAPNQFYSTTISLPTSL